ncbi:hypothetical protein [Methylocystis parvus]|uniref:hypothetical protein n=1 Tax=Methylocystis parvus TaxID=134 RepID=UPI003C78250A
MMRLWASLIFAFAAGCSYSTAALAGVELTGGGYPSSRLYRGGAGLVRGPDGVWRYYGPSDFGPSSPDDPSFWDCYVYDNYSRQWVWKCN